MGLAAAQQLFAPSWGWMQREACAAQEWAKNAMAGRASKADKLGTVDHSQIDYPPFRRSFYIETQELAKMREEDVAAYRKELDDVKVRAPAVSSPLVHGAAHGQQAPDARLRIVDCKGTIEHRKGAA